MKIPTHVGLDQPLLLTNHARPRTRRELIAQGFKAGIGTVMGGSIASMLASSPVFADLSPDLQDLLEGCDIKSSGSGTIPFICFDLAGGANIAGSNVLVGGRGGQLDFLTTAGYSKLGLPGNMLPGQTNAANVGEGGGTAGHFFDDRLGLAFHSDSAMLKGIIKRTNALTWANTQGCVMAARSENDTGNNPHNPMYGINQAGADGSLLALIGSQSSESGGNSMAPAYMVNPKVRPTKVDRPSDATGLVDVGDLTSLLAPDETVSVMESMYRLSSAKLSRAKPKLTDANGNLLPEADAALRKTLGCTYLKSAYLANAFGQPGVLNPLKDPAITSIFPEGINKDGEYAKTASVMKLVMGGFAGAGTITMGGFDYHTGDRTTGEMRDYRAGECIGAVLEYARLKNSPVMIYVFSDGSVFSNGMPDMAANGKGVWTGDNQQTAAAYMLVYNPKGRPALTHQDPNKTYADRQIGYMAGSGDVDTSSSPIANNVNLLVETVVLNYLALHGRQGEFGDTLFPKQGLGNATSRDRLTMFASIK